MTRNDYLSAATSNEIQTTLNSKAQNDPWNWMNLSWNVWNYFKERNTSERFGCSFPLLKPSFTL